LTDETIARLVDEAPTALEAAHLSACAACRDELQAMHAQVAQLSALPELQPPPADWEHLERKLAAEGLIRERAPRRLWLHYGMRVAAALVLFVGGTMTGRLLWTTSAPPDSQLAAAPPAVTADTPAAGNGELLAPAPELAAQMAATPARATSADTHLASQETQGAPRTAEEWLREVQRTERAYLDALTHFAELSGTTTTGDPAARLAALEGIVLTTRAALGKAPTDEVINGYYLNAMAQRDATIRQISATNAESWF